MDGMDKVTAHLSFDYRGQSHEMSAELVLADCLWSSADGVLDAPRLIADANGVDVWSYEFEIMQQSEVWFDDAQGLASVFVQDGRFDAAGYRAAWQQQVDAMLSPEWHALIAGNADWHVRLQQAIRQAWLQGYAAGRADADPVAKTPENR